MYIRIIWIYKLKTLKIAVCLLVDLSIWSNAVMLLSNPIYMCAHKYVGRILRWHSYMTLPWKWGNWIIDCKICIRRITFLLMAICFIFRSTFEKCTQTYRFNISNYLFYKNGNIVLYEMLGKSNHKQLNDCL